MSRYIRFALILVVLGACPAFAQNVDTQVRLGLQVAAAEPENHVGLAAWALVPDATAAPFRSLFLGGVMLKADGPLKPEPKRKAANRIQFLAGGFVGGGRFHPVLDSRLFLNFSGLDLYQEVVYVTSTNKVKLEQCLRKMLHPGKAKFAVGVGSEIFVSGPFFAPARKSLYGVGPEVLVPIGSRLAVFIQYQFRNANRAGDMFRVNAVVSP